MSPEQILGRAIDQRSDIFSFGCIVYEVITGRRPFDGESFVDTLHEVLHATPPAIQHDELQRIVNKCLVKDRESRYQSIRDVALDLRAAALGPLTMGLPSRTPVPGSRAPGPGVPGLAALAGGWAPTRRATVMGVLIAAAIALAGWVAYVFVPRGTAPVAVVAAPRTVLQRITTNGHIGHLAISPDGRFAGYTVEDDESGSSIWLQQLATGSHIAVVPPTKKTYYAGLTFSADANHLIDTHYEDSIYGVVTERPILGGKLSKLVHDADTGVSPSPDGRWLVMTRNVLDKGESRVLVTARDGSQERIVAAQPLPKTALSPVWSPDGKRIAVAHGAGLFTIDAASGVKTGVPLAGRHGVIRDVAWNGNDSVILSAADEHAAGHFQLLRVALPTGTMTTVTSDSDDYIEPRLAGDSVAAIQIKHQATLWTVTPGATPIQVTRGIGSSDGLAGATSTHDGRLVYTSSAGGTIDLWIANADGSDARQLTNDDRLESQPNVTPNDATIVYLTRASGLSTLWRMNIDGSQPRVIAEAPAIYDYALTPDGKRVVYAAGDDRTKRTTLFSIPTDGGAPSPITTTGVYLKAIQVSPDGGTILFSTLHEDLIKVFKVAIGGGAVTRLTDVRSGDASFSPDGKLVACAYELQEGHAKLGILPPGGGKPLQILPLDGRHYHWTPDGKGIAYIKQTGKQENLFLQPLAGGPAKALTNFTEGSIANYEWSRDGSRILLTHYIQTRDVVLLTTTKG
jgi:Tol biopolymer transport system component